MYKEFPHNFSHGKLDDIHEENLVLQRVKAPAGEPNFISLSSSAEGVNLIIKTIEEIIVYLIDFFWGEYNRHDDFGGYNRHDTNILRVNFRYCEYTSLKKITIYHRTFGSE
ncbi:hypothetical protein DMUE_0446 [Dictyocoela muelleri]|nr:hypothetical protein DMUE_0446 [Dictyocoela muelleri]